MQRILHATFFCIYKKILSDNFYTYLNRMINNFYCIYCLELEHHKQNIEKKMTSEIALKPVTRLLLLHHMPHLKKPYNKLYN